MPRADTKADLLAMANGQWDKMRRLIDSLPPSEQDADFRFDAESKGKEAHWKRDKNLRDVLIHLYEWHRLLLEWEESNASGVNRPFLPPPYTWKTYGEMNKGFWEKHQRLNTPLEDAKAMLTDSHKRVLAVIEKYTDEQLFTKAYYKWTGTSSLGQYCISATASHYDWAMKKIKEQIKALK